MDVKITPMGPEDSDEARSLWSRSPGIGLSSADEPDAIRRYLDRNRGLSFSARDGVRLVGTVLCGHDGRRGYLHHLAVDADYRGRGLGRALTERGLRALRSAGVEKCHLFVKRENEAAAAFWSRVGWTERIDLRMYSIDLPPEAEPRDPH